MISHRKPPDLPNSQIGKKTNRRYSSTATKVIKFSASYVDCVDTVVRVVLVTAVSSEWSKEQKGLGAFVLRRSSSQQILCSRNRRLRSGSMCVYERSDGPQTVSSPWGGLPDNLASTYLRTTVRYISDSTRMKSNT